MSNYRIDGPSPVDVVRIPLNLEWSKRSVSAWITKISPRADPGHLDGNC